MSASLIKVKKCTTLGKYKTKMTLFRTTTFKMMQPVSQRYARKITASLRLAFLECVADISVLLLFSE